MWDCGNYWDEYDSPVHVGLDDGLLRDYKEQLKAWNSTYCYPLVEAGKSCLKRSDPAGAAAATGQAVQSEYYQEVSLAT